MNWNEAKKSKIINIEITKEERKTIENTIKVLSDLYFMLAKIECDCMQFDDDKYTVEISDEELERNRTFLEKILCIDDIVIAE